MRRILTYTLAFVAALSVVGPAGPAAAALAPTAAGVSIPGNKLMAMTQTDLDKNLARVAASGVRWLRFDVAAAEIEATQGGANWTKIDRVVTSARSAGLELLGIVTTLPAWSRPAGTIWNYGPKTDAERAAFADFAARAATRYAGRINTWEVWNEPNLDQFWSPTPRASDYAALLKVAYPAIKKAVPSALVISGGTGWAGSSPDIASVQWYTSLYALGANLSFDAATVHPYADFTNVAGGEMGKAVQIRDLMDAHGDAAKLLWGTETGAPTGGSASTTEANQAKMLVDGYNYWNAIRNHGPLFWHTLKDTTNTTREGYFGLLRLDGSAKPAYGAMQSYLTAMTATPTTDTVAPVVSVTSPTEGATVSGTVDVSVDATDSGGVNSVEVMLDGVVRGRSTTAPYLVRLDSTVVANGVHTLTARAMDLAGNATVSAGRSINVLNAVATTTAGTSVTSLSSAPSGADTTFAFTLQSSAPMAVNRVIVAVRDSLNGNHDLLVTSATTLTGTQNFGGTTRLAVGTYTYRVAYLRNGSWVNLNPKKTVEVVSSTSTIASTLVTTLTTTTSATGVTANVTLNTTGQLPVDRLIVAIRNSAGTNYDLTVRSAGVLSGVQSFTASRSLPVGAYTGYVAYYKDSRWTPLQPTRSFSVATA